MKFVNPEVVQHFREGRWCEWCLRPTPGGTHPAHVFACGRSNGFRMDIPENLLSLCWICHAHNHNGAISTRELVEVVSEREGLWPDDLWQILQRLRMA